MKTLKLHCLVHAPFENEGYIKDWIQQNGHQLTYTKLYSNETLPASDSVDGLIIMGGPMSVNDEKKHPWLKTEKQFILHVIEEEKPVLGICLGAQLIANVLGAKTHIAEQKEIGWWPVEIIRDGILGQPQEITTFHWHGETFSLPENSTLLAQSKAIAHQAFLFNDRTVGLQFHPEMTPQGIEQLIQNCSEDITTGAFIHTAKEMLAQTNHFEQNRTLLFYLLQNLFKNTVTH